MRIVLDTNALLISIPKLSPYRPIFDALLDKRLTLIVSNEILSEYAEVIERKTTPSVAHNIVEMLISLSNVERSTAFYHWHLIEQDNDDNKFVDIAIAANADAIVTNDRHFDVLKTIAFPPVRVMSVKDFLKAL